MIGLRSFVVLLGLGIASLVFGQSNTSLGAGLEAVGPGSKSNAFVDVVKQAAGFTKPDGSAVTKDASGWPKEDASLVLLTANAGEQSIYVGAYLFSFAGQADVSVDLGGGSATGVSYNAAKNVTTGTFNFDPGASGNAFRVSFTNTTGGIKNLRVFRPGYPLTTTQTFTTAFVNQVKRFNILKFTTWTKTNGSLASSWSQRSKTTDACYTGPYGVPWETCLDLANAANRGVWINIPAHAADVYIKNLALLIDARLTPGLRVFEEYGNENWNFAYEQAQYNFDKAQQEVSAGGSDLQYPDETAKNGDGTWVHKTDFFYRKLAKRAMQCASQFRNNFGAAAFGDRLRPVLAGQTSTPLVALEGLDWVNFNYGPPNDFFFGLAVAPYFGIGAADANALSSDQVLAALSSSIDGIFAFHSSGKPTLQTVAMATYYGLKPLAYEGGVDTSGPNNIQAKMDATANSAMRTMSVRYLGNWYKAGGTMFAWQNAGASDYTTAFGTFGLTGDMTNPVTPKNQAMDDVLGVTKPAATLGMPTPGILDARDFVGANADWATASPALQNLSAGATFDYVVRSPRLGTGKVRLLMSSATAGAEMDVLVNNQWIGTLLAPNTGSLSKYGWTAAIRVPLNQSLNVVRLRVFTPNAFNVASVQVLGVGDTFPPEISALQDQSVSLGTSSSPQSFTISDPDTPRASLVVTATSDNQVLVPDANITIAGLGAVRTISVTPTSSNEGSAHITVTVSDGTATATSTFQVFFVNLVPALRGDYYKGIDLSGGIVFTHREAPIDFEFGWGGPPGLSAENYSIRWTGYIRISQKGLYRFYTRTDDGVRLWINGALVIDHWVVQPPTDWASPSIQFQAGQLVSIKMEYYNGPQFGSAKLYWSSADIPKQLIPLSALFSDP